MILAWFLGCTPCETATCQADRAVADWAKDPKAVTERVRAIPDDMVRTVVVGRLVEAYPGQTRTLCEALPHGTSRSRCERLNGRPHLGDVADVAKTVVRSGDVPVDGVVVSSLPERGRHATLPEVYLSLPPETLPADTCATVADPQACLDQLAVEAVSSGNGARAAGACALHQHEKWRDECRFHAAEESIRSRRGPGYAAAAALCSGTGFAQECLSHILTRLVGTAPYADADATAIQPALDAVRYVREAWAPVDPAVGERHVERFWALYFANVYREERSPDGTPMAVYPAEVAPHVRAALTMRLGAMGRLEGGLDAQVAQVSTALARRDARPRPRGRPADLVYVADLGDPPESEPWTYYLGAARRPVSSDEAEDVALSVLETAVRQEPPDRALLDEAALRPGLVGEEARRLLTVLGG